VQPLHLHLVSLLHGALSSTSLSTNSRHNILS
jgi:hypothetical protein